ncbi:MAG: helix-turn-helix domain-containing protein [Acidobacteriota bacterium]|nr:helix-turn-helix domain-containing protein [Acidobacteriota bacterium]
MQSVGRILSQARQAQGRSLELISSRTRISLGKLRNIEADELTEFHSAFFYKSFVKQFAAELQLDYAALESAVQAASAAIPLPLIPGEEGTFTPKVAALRIGKRRKSRLLLSLSSFAVVLVACSAIYSGWQSSRLRLSESWHALIKPHNYSAIAANSSPQPAAATLLPEQPLPSRSLDYALSGSQDKVTGGYTIVVSATEPAWLSIVTDGKQSFKGILEKTETKVLEGRENARLRTGNAGAVTVVFNGRDLGALGPRGQIRTVLFTKNDYEVLDRPAHVALTGFSRTAELAQLFDFPAF